LFEKRQGNYWKWGVFDVYRGKWPGGGGQGRSQVKFWQVGLWLCGGSGNGTGAIFEWQFEVYGLGNQGLFGFELIIIQYLKLIVIIIYFYYFDMEVISFKYILALEQLCIIFIFEWLF
jgi:hypothetical protein